MIKDPQKEYIDEIARLKLEIANVKNETIDQCQDILSTLATKNSFDQYKMPDLQTCRYALDKARDN